MAPPSLAALCASRNWEAATILLSSLPPLEIASALSSTHGKSAWTPLHYASLSNPTPEILEQLLSLGASPGATGSAGSTPLHLASWHGTDAVEKLLAAGARLDVETVSGRTALHFAAVRGNEAVVRMLLAAGAEDTRDGDGVSAREFARSGGFDGVLSVLDEFARGEEVVAGGGDGGVEQFGSDGGVVTRGMYGLGGARVRTEIERFAGRVRSDVVLAGAVGFVLGVLAPRNGK